MKTLIVLFSILFLKVKLETSFQTPEVNPIKLAQPNTDLYTKLEATQGVNKSLQKLLIQLKDDIEIKSNNELITTIDDMLDNINFVSKFQSKANAFNLVSRIKEVISQLNLTNYEVYSQELKNIFSELLEIDNPRKTEKAKFNENKDNKLENTVLENFQKINNNNNSKNNNKEIECVPSECQGCCINNSCVAEYKCKLLYFGVGGLAVTLLVCFVGGIIISSSYFAMKFIKKLKNKIIKGKSNNLQLQNYTADFNKGEAIEFTNIDSERDFNKSNGFKAEKNEKK